MCGRYGLTLDGQDLVGLLQLELELGEELHLEPRYNIAPSQRAPVVRLDRGGRRRLHQVQWGLVPSWAKEPGIGSKMINARAETAAEKPSFRDALQRRRCLVPTDGFYEWTTVDGAKQAHHIGAPDGGLLCFAGLWERWTDPEGAEPLDTFTILTTSPNQLMGRLHHRMPVILDPTDYDRWLDRRHSAQEVSQLMRPCPNDLLTSWPVSSLVNSPRNDAAACRAPIEIPDNTR